MSLSAALGYAVQGKGLLRHWMQTPCWDLPELHRRQHAIELFLQDDVTRQQLRSELKQACLLQVQLSMHDRQVHADLYAAACCSCISVLDMK